MTFADMGVWNILHVGKSINQTKSDNRWNVLCVAVLPKTQNTTNEASELIEDYTHFPVPETWHKMQNFS